MRRVTTAWLVPPLTRRCASYTDSSPGPRHGSSAHAEMRRSSPPRSAKSKRFLRSRGDAPARATARPRSRWVPPLTRRCAERRDQGLLRRDGSSAHAEMRRPCGGCVEDTRRFLRSRGDAPPGTKSKSERAEVPPLTRRCAREPEGPVLAQAGSSAHAEMRRGRTARPTAWSWFLRSRGDAPIALDMIELILEVPPLTRRCAGVGRAVRG